MISAKVAIENGYFEEGKNNDLCCMLHAVCAWQTKILCVCLLQAVYDNTGFGRHNISSKTNNTTWSEWLSLTGGLPNEGFRSQPLALKDGYNNVSLRTATRSNASFPPCRR